ncbi:MAG TPA: GGDEF domain-containing protein, partial [Vicinamibacteria bacterium]|nr:GGDEF domain-containing protein [Vicinamibacteria bacterium]
MSIAASAAAEVAERDRERQRRSDAALAPLREAVARLEGRSPEEAAADEKLWHVVQAAFDVDPRIVNLNNGGVSPSPRLVQEALRRELGRARRTGLPLSLVLVDVDHLKKVNDTFGHPAGDSAIRHVAGALREARRDTDVVARFGGEEFALLLPGTDHLGAIKAAERVRVRLSTTL